MKGKIGVEESPDRICKISVNMFDLSIDETAILSVVDLTSGYHQIEIHPDDRTKSSFTATTGVRVADIAVKEDLQATQQQDTKCQEWMLESQFVSINGVLYRETKHAQRIVLPEYKRAAMLKECNESLYACHCGRKATNQRVAEDHNITYKRTSKMNQQRASSVPLQEWGCWRREGGKRSSPLTKANRVLFLVGSQEFSHVRKFLLTPPKHYATAPSFPQYIDFKSQPNPQLQTTGIINGLYGESFSRNEALRHWFHTFCAASMGTDSTGDYDDRVKVKDGMSAVESVCVNAHMQDVRLKSDERGGEDDHVDRIIDCEYEDHDSVDDDYSLVIPTHFASELPSKSGAKKAEGVKRGLRLCSGLWSRLRKIIEQIAIVEMILELIVKLNAIVELFAQLIDEINARLIDRLMKIPVRQLAVWSMSLRTFVSWDRPTLPSIIHRAPQFRHIFSPSASRHILPAANHALPCQPALFEPECTTCDLERHPCSRELTCFPSKHHVTQHDDPEQHKTTCQPQDNLMRANILLYPALAKQDTREPGYHEDKVFSQYVFGLPNHTNTESTPSILYKPNTYYDYMPEDLHCTQYGITFQNEWDDINCAIYLESCSENAVSGSSSRTVYGGTYAHPYEILPLVLCPMQFARDARASKRVGSAVSTTKPRQGGELYMARALEARRHFCSYRHKRATGIIPVVRPASPEDQGFTPRECKRTNLFMIQLPIVIYVKMSLNGDSVSDHDHLSGKFRGATHRDCNLSYINSFFVQVFIHNLSDYDTHLFIRYHGSDENRIDLIPNNKEKLICFTKRTRVKKFNIKSQRKYTELYNKSDVLILSYIMENFGDVCIKTYKLDRAWYYTAPD
ncbi:hypothetical protein PR048_029766 [Dryococelus australis]|uniref:Uncharacterized protein n=1 Tax=Dryococelus australis TaxID=614101 RepID=A0ABQ9G719_9NEOP|nr:hypothetical protein PR048_029766 [Dryococelus australis]